MDSGHAECAGTESPAGVREAGVRGGGRWIGGCGHHELPDGGVVSDGGDAQPVFALLGQVEIDCERNQTVIVKTAAIGDFADCGAGSGNEHETRHIAGKAGGREIDVAENIQLEAL